MSKMSNESNDSKKSKESKGMQFCLNNLLLLSLLSLLSLLPLFAAFDDLGAGARAPGMGNAFTSVADDVYSIFYNPAGLGTLERPQFTSSYSRLLFGLSDNSDINTAEIAYVQPLKKGRWGSLGAAWQSFSLAGLYQEQNLYLSYGRLAWQSQKLGELYLGGNAKYLTRSFTRFPEASNSLDGINATGQSDPVLSGRNSQGFYDLDLGLLYRTPKRYSLGLNVQHLTRPNIAFSSSDEERLPMRIKAGLGYKSLWTNFALETHFQESPSGSLDKDFILGAERYFPTLDYGQFGIRASLGIGSRDFRQITAGLTYRISKLQVDYGFIVPLGTVQSTLGTHRVALTIHFGAPTKEEEISAQLLEKAAKLERKKDEGYAYEFEGLKERIEEKEEDIEKQQWQALTELIQKGEFQKASLGLTAFLQKRSADQALLNLSIRLKEVTSFYAQFPSPQKDWEKALFLGIQAYLSRRDSMAIEKVSEALTLNPRDIVIPSLLEQMEKSTKIKVPKKPAAPAPATIPIPAPAPAPVTAPRPAPAAPPIEEILDRAQSAIEKERFQEAARLCQDILKKEPENIPALEKLGYAYYSLTRYDQALEAWEKMRSIQKEEKKDVIYYLIQELKKKQAPAPAKVKPAPAVPAPKAGPREIEKLYQKATEEYAKGNLTRAAALFIQILELDPGNAQAKKALNRIQSELGRQGEKP